MTKVMKALYMKTDRAGCEVRNGDQESKGVDGGMKHLVVMISMER